MRLSRTLLLLPLAVATPAVAQRQQARPNSAISIPFERYTLPNGLSVVLSPNQSTPTVAVDLWYHVGSKNEARGRTGFAHMFEHVMFTGSGNVPYGLHDRLTEGVGGNNNGSTSNDRTNYFENVPSNYVETAIWLESDRMGFLLDKLDSAKFIAQRDIVQNERRQGVDNQPYGRAFEILSVGLYPETHPYSWPVVGYMSDLQKATLEDVKNFFRLYYAPGNATIAIVGDFDPAQAKQWVTKYFGDLPKGRAITRPTVVPPTITREKRFHFEDRVQVPRLYIAWPTIGAKHDDTYALNVLAQVFTGSRTARLTKALVYDRQSAAQVSAFQSPNENVGEFAMMLTPRPGHTLTELELAADSVVERLKREGPTADEMTRALAGIEFQYVSGLQSNLGKAETLLEGSVFFGDPGHYRSEYTKMKAVTASDVKRVVNTYLGAGRVVLSMVPEGKADQASKAQGSTKVTVGPDGGHYNLGTLP
ncbi:MAG: M16 family metallopeptidase [Gemmatimonadaceae bacterium]